MIGEAEVVVGTQIDDFRAVADPDDGLLRRGQHTLGLEQPLLPQLFGVVRQPSRKSLFTAITFVRARSADSAIAATACRWIGRVDAAQAALSESLVTACIPRLLKSGAEMGFVCRKSAR